MPRWYRPCWHCGKRIPFALRRTKRYCSSRCKWLRYLQRKWHGKTGQYYLDAEAIALERAEQRAREAQMRDALARLATAQNVLLRSGLRRWSASPQPAAAAGWRGCGSGRSTSAACACR